MKPILVLSALFPLLIGAVFAGPDTENYYSIETIPFPEGVPPEVGALGISPEGHLFVALRRSDVLMAKPADDPKDWEWTRFASGLHNACGIHVISSQEIVISQMPEVTRITDTDGDGKGDRYENLASSWGMSGNYHETNHLMPDGKGGYFVAVGTASHNGPVFYNVRGDYSKIGRRGRNYSAVSWKGWVLHVDAKGNTTPWASGFRMHNGIFLDSKGRLWSGDNQGDWKATTPLYHIEKGNFYGHVSSLIWDSEWEEGEDPLLLPVEEIDAMKTDAAVLLPHELMNRSASEPIEFPAAFGPYAGQLLLPDNNGTRISRIMLEEVNGIWQGACTHFINDDKLGSGNNRVAFSPDRKSLYVGQTSRGWGKLAEGVKRITWTGEMPFDVDSMSLEADGFRLHFTKPLPEDVLENALLEMVAYHYQDTAEYGGDQLDRQVIELGPIERLNAETLFVSVPDLKAGGWVYELAIEGVRAADGTGLFNKHYCYTVNQLAQP